MQTTITIEPISEKEAENSGQISTIKAIEVLELEDTMIIRTPNMAEVRKYNASHNNPIPTKPTVREQIRVCLGSPGSTEKAKSKTKKPAAKKGKQSKTASNRVC